MCSTRPEAMPRLEHDQAKLPRPRFDAPRDTVASAFMPMHWTALWAKSFDSSRFESTATFEAACAEMERRIGEQRDERISLRFTHLVHLPNACLGVLDTVDLPVGPSEERWGPTVVIAFSHPGGSQAIAQWPKQADRWQFFKESPPGTHVVEIDFIAAGLLKRAVAPVAAEPGEATTCSGELLMVTTNARPSRQTEPTGIVTLLFCDEEQSKVWATKLAASIKQRPAGPELAKLKARVQAEGRPGHIYLKWGAVAGDLDADALVEILEGRLKQLRESGVTT